MKIYLMQRKGQTFKKSIEKGKAQMNSLHLTYVDEDTKKRTYRFLKLYVYDKPKNSIEKEHNKETTLLAEAIRAQEVLNYQSKKHGFVSAVNVKVSFLEFFKHMTDKKSDDSRGT